MEENKYYTPAIEEFHVGFEYEVNHENNWVSEIQMEGFLHNKKLENIRVKYLDREDIEAEGFVHSDIINDERQLFFKDTEKHGNTLTCGLLHIPKTNWVLIYSHDKKVEGVFQGGYVIELPENKVSVLGGTMFAGKARNASELKRILNQIGVT